jgi:hypothetical protein
MVPGRVLAHSQGGFYNPGATDHLPAIVPKSAGACQARSRVLPT